MKKLTVLMIMLYVLAVMMESNWPILPATLIGVFLIFKDEKDGREKIVR